MRLNFNRYTRLLWIGILLVALIIVNACVFEPPKVGLRIVVANVQEQQEDESDAEAAIRMEEHGRFIRGSGFAGLWSLVAANELPAQKLTGSIPGIGPDHWRAKTLDCPSDGTDEKLLSVYCLAWGLEPDLDMQPHQKGELGIIARDKYLEQLLINGEPYFAKFIGPERNGIQRRMLASRYEIMNTDKSVMFVATHLSHTGASHDERTEELKDLISNVKQLYVPGDLTPILAGDFNCDTWSEQERKVINEDFMIVSDGEWTEQAFVGRPQSFPGNSGVLWPEAVTHLFNPQDRQGNPLTDHRAHLYVELSYLEPQFDFIAPPVESVPGEGCIAPTCVASDPNSSVWDTNSLAKFDFEGDMTVETPDHTVRWEDVNKYRPIIELKYPTCQDMG